MHFVGSLTARPIKNYYVFKLQQLSGHIISKYNNNNNNNNNNDNSNNDNHKNNNNKIYMHSNYSDQSVQSDERSLITKRRIMFITHIAQM